MKITKEIAYKYLKEKGTMGKYTNDFNIVDIFTESARPGIKEHPVIRCEYTEGATTFHTQYKNVHIDLIKFNEWITRTRENLLDELLNKNLK
jgi:hypothetical protein